MLPINDKEGMARGEVNRLNPSMQRFKGLELITSALQKISSLLSNKLNISPCSYKLLGRICAIHGVFLDFGLNSI